MINSNDLSMDNFLKEFQFRQLFVKVEKEKRSSFATVTNDGWYVDFFPVKSSNQREFEIEAEQYLESERFTQKLKEQRGY